MAQVYEPQRGDYNLEISNWVNMSTGEKLSGYKPPSHLKDLLGNNLNITHQ